MLFRSVRVKKMRQIKNLERVRDYERAPGATPGRVVRKWRPSVGLITGLVMVAALTLPLAGLFFFRIYEDQIIHQTEAELIAQSAALAAVVRREIEAGTPDAYPLGAAVPPPAPTEPYQPIPPTLDLTRDDLLARRPEGKSATAPATPGFVALGERLAPDFTDTQRVTLAGFRLLDPNGTVIAGRDELGLSLAHVEEVADALRGHFRSVLRLRISKHDPPPVYSWSRGTGVRVFTAMPVVVRDHVAAVIYASRTPSNIFKSFYQERWKVAMAGLTIAGLALLIGLLFQRTITGPMRELMHRTDAMRRGERDALTALSHHGTAEFARLSQSFLDMADHLQTRWDFIATFTAHVSHELKSPLTAIKGAAELLRDDLDPAGIAMTADDRRRFLDNIIADAGRLTAIVQSLRELARAETTPVTGVATLQAVTADLRATWPRLAIATAGDDTLTIAMAADNLRIVLSHLADNAVRHGATHLAIAARGTDDEVQLTIADDGDGISPNNRDRIFDSFFTTRRDSGGTGMGLPIVRAMLAAHHGRIDLSEPVAGAAGAVFVITLPRAADA